VLIAGIVCLLVAGALGFFAWRQHERLRRMQSTETLTCAAIAERRAAAVEAGGPGSFRLVCEVSGVAAPGEGGALRGPESGSETVWHRVTLSEHCWDTDVDADGDKRRERKVRLLESEASDASFALDDGTGTILVATAAADVDEPSKTSDRFTEERTDVEDASGVAGAMQTVQRWTSSTIGFEYVEWAIRPGQRLFVVGEATDAGGRLEMAKPADGRLLISTRTEEQLQRSAGRWSRGLGIAAAALAVIGLGLAIAGLVV
jgi:E3 Ubiquitin ligase